MITWDQQYETGIQTIDDQHKHLIGITSRLSELLTNAIQGDDIFDEMVEIIHQLTDYTVYHFRFEEELFQKLDYVNRVSHTQEHNNLIAEIEKLDLRAVDEDQITHGKKILKFLISWVFKHISGTDFLYVDLFKAHNIQ